MAMDRRRVAIAGTSSYIGAAVTDALADRFHVVALTRSPARTQRQEEAVRWIQYDHFSRRQVEASLQGVDYAVYLVHNQDPSARLDQARARDRDLLVADNFARGASRAGVRQIVYRMQRPPGPSAGSAGADGADEVMQVLSSHGVPVTVLRTGLVIGPGGEIVRLLVHIVKRLPLIPLPRPDQTVNPLSIADLMTAFRYCVGNPETFGRSYDVSGPEAVTLQRLLEMTAAMAGSSPRYVRATHLPERVFAFLLRLVHGKLQPEFRAYLLGTLRIARTVADSDVQQAIARQALPFRSVLERCVREAEQGTIETRQQRQRERDDEILRMAGRVRSIQRLRLPAGKNAAWVADHYFSWLGRTLRPFLRTEPGPGGSWVVRSGPGRVTLLSLTFQPDHSSPDRCLYFITGGMLAEYLGGQTARLEFRDLLGARFTIAAIHDFNPSLPWFFYRFTQAIVHAMVMKGFQRHMARLADATPERQ